MVIVLFLVLLLSVGVASGQERTLHWKSLDVSARLEADASLHVVERHTMLFDGAWNGGERRFRVEQGQNLRLLHLRRIDETGTQELKLGNLANTGSFAWSGRALRWRTRQPSDPPYRNTILTFEIDYVLYGIVEKAGDVYFIDHDFAFPDRSGVIEHYTLNFEHDPVWAGDRIAPVEKANLPPGESVVLHQQLEFKGAGEPAHIYRRPPPLRPPPPPPPPPPPWRLSPVARVTGAGILLVIFIVLVDSFFRHERDIGRFEKWDDLLPAGEGWLQKNIFSYPPEVIGAAWDETTAEPEVAALLARLVQEGKIKTIPKQMTTGVTITQLQLMVKRATLQEHERALVDALFRSGDVTDPPAIRAAYQSVGFNPATVLQGPLMRKADAVTARAFGRPSTVSRNVGVLLIISLSIAFFAGLFTRGGLTRFALFAGVCLLISLGLARRYRWKLLGRESAALVVVPPAAIMSASVSIAHPVAFAIAAAMTVAISWYVLRKARWHGTRELLQWRRNLVAAHDWFAVELSKPEPRLKDDWTPWIIGFGLSSAMDEWTRSYGRPGLPLDTISSTSRESRSSIAREPEHRHDAPIWTGGGGAFGGGGATGGWAAELSSYAASVAAPVSSYSSGGGSSSSFSSSSSSSSFSSSSSSSSSGGGGGGGW